MDNILNRDMGYLTTITFRNDAFDSFDKNRDELVDGILASIIGSPLEYFSVGPDANPVITQRPKHADDMTLYLHAGNTVVEVDRIRKDCNEWAINDAIKEMENQLERLRKLKEYGE